MKILLRNRKSTKQKNYCTLEKPVHNIYTEGNLLQQLQQLEYERNMNSIPICTFNKLSWVCPLRPTSYSTPPTIKSNIRKFPAILAIIMFTCHVGSHVEFLSTKNFLGYIPKLSSCRPKMGTSPKGWTLHQKPK